MRDHVGILKRRSNRLCILRSIVIVLVLPLSLGIATAKRPVATKLPVIAQISLPTTKGWINQLQVTGDYAYAYNHKGSGKIPSHFGIDEFVIIDVLDTRHPKLVSVTDELPKEVFGFAADGDRAFLNFGPEGLFLLDLSNRASPSAVETGIELAKGPIWVTENLLFATAEDDALVVYDVADASHPVEVGRLPEENLLIHEIVGDRLYGTNRLANLVIVEFSTPSHPKVLGSATISGYKPATGWIPREIVVSGDYIYVAHTRGKAKLVDATDPTNPVVVAKFGPGGGGGFGYEGAAELAVSGNRVYLNARNGLYAFDLSDKMNPTPILKAPSTGIRAQPDWCCENILGIHGHFLYMAGNWLNLYDLSKLSPGTPYRDWERTRLCFELDGYDLQPARIVGDYLYIVANARKKKQEESLVIVSVKDLESP